MVEGERIHRDLDVLLECMQSSPKVGVLKIVMPNVSHPGAWSGPYQNSSVLPGLGSDLHWNLLHIQSNVNCRETTSGVWSGCVYHTLEVGQSTCLCVLVTPQAIKWMMFVLHQCTLYLPVCDGVHSKTVDIGWKNAFIWGLTIAVDF